MAKIIGNTTTTPMAIPDWNQTDDKKADYIKNKPNIIGQQTPDGGEIFNDYENNKALKNYTTAIGQSTIAGCKAFSILSVDMDKLTMTLDSVEGLTTNMLCSCQYSNNHDFFGKIIEIDTENKIVKFDALPSDTFVEGQTNLLWIPSNPELGTRNTGSCASAEGCYTKAVQIASHAEGSFTIAAGKYSHAEGSNTKAAYSAHSEGLETEALGQGSHSEGRQTKAKGYASHTEGGNSIAEGNFSHAEGLNSKAIGMASHAEGINTIAEGNYSHAEGNGCRAIGDMSRVMGNNSIANATSSFVSGTNSSTSNVSDFSFVHGQNAKAGVVEGQQAKWCVAMGKDVQTDANVQIALGTFNNLSDRSNGQRPVFMVGYGTSNSARKNNFTVFRNGVARVGANPIDDMDVATKGYVTSQISSLASASLTRSIVSELPTPANAKENVIYMIPVEDETENNIYDEYMFFVNNEGDLIPELIGNTAVEWTGTPAKSLVFNTKANLDGWASNHKNLFNINELQKNPYTNAIEFIFKENGKFDLKINEVVEINSVDWEQAFYDFHFNLETNTDYIISSNCDLFYLEHEVGNGANFRRIKITQEGAIFNFGDFKLDAKGGFGRIYVECNEIQEIKDCWIQIEKGTQATSFEPYIVPFSREDGLVKDDLAEGDILLIKEENTPDYYWDGNGLKEIEVSIPENIATQDYVQEQLSTTNKSLIFDTKSDLDSWVKGAAGGKNLFNSNTQDGSISLDYNYFETEYGEWEFEAIPVNYNFTLEPGNYVLWMKSNDPGIPMDYNFKINNISQNSLIEVTYDDENTFYEAKFNLDKSSNISLSLATSNITWLEAWVQIEEGNEFTGFEPYIPPYTREDGLAKADLIEGDLLLVKKPNASDFYWDGEALVEIEASIPENIATEDYVQEQMAIINKNLIFDTKENLDNWIVSKNLLEIRNISYGGDGSPSYGIILNEDGTFEAYDEIQIGGVPSIDFTFPEDGIYTISGNSGYCLRNNEFYDFTEEGVQYEAKAGEQLSFVDMNGKNLWLQVEKGETCTPFTPYGVASYVREDGLTYHDLNKGDLLLIEEEGTPDYYWNGTTHKAIETQMPDIDMSNYYTKEEVMALINEAIGAALEGEY